MRQIDLATLEQIELAYKAGTKSVNAIAKTFAVPEATLRRLAKKNGWVRGAPDIKRQIVADHFAGVTKGLANDEVRQSQELAAGADIEDMERGLRLHRRCLIQLEATVVGATDPKVIKTITEATALAITGIRKIRGLDTPTPADATDLDAAIEAELAHMERLRQAGPAPDAEGT
ncbi:hypothetical protein [Burkholderia glumae]